MNNGNEQHPSCCWFWSGASGRYLEQRRNMVTKTIEEGKDQHGHYRERELLCESCGRTAVQREYGV